MINMEEYEERAEKLKVLAHPHRLCIVRGLMGKKCNVTKMQECLDIPQSTVSQHMAKLKTAGIICGKRNGTEIEYSVVDDEAKEIIKVLFKNSEKITGDK